MKAKFITSILTLGLLIMSLPGVAYARDEDPFAHLIVEEDFGDYWTLFYFDASNSYDEETHLPDLRFR